MINIESAVKLAFLSMEELKWVQSSLTSLGYDAGKIDGVFGNNTLYAFNRFKEDYSLTEAGVIGPTTIQIMQLALNGVLDKTEKEEAKSEQPSFSGPQKIDFIDWHSFSSPVSEFFTIGEVSQWDKNRIVTNPIIRQNVVLLAKELDKIRVDWGKPIGVSSWYRPPAINRAVGGAKYSSHLTGSAADIFPIGGDIYAFQKWLDARWTKALGYGAKRGFVHVDLRSQPKKIRWPY